MGSNSPGQTSSDYWNKTNALGTTIMDQLRQMQSAQSQQQQGASTSTGNTTTTTSLAPGQDQNVGLLLQGARDNYAQSTAPTATTVAGRGSQLNFANGQGSDLIGAALSGDRSLLSTQGINNPQNDPTYQAMAKALTESSNKNLMESVLPQVRSGAIANNALGGSRDALVTGKAVGDASTGLASTLAQLMSQTRGQNVDIYNTAANRVGTDYSLGLAPGSTLESLGQRDQADRAAALATLQQLTGTSGQYGGSQSTSGTQAQNTSSTGVTNTSSTESTQGKTDTDNKQLTTGYGQGTQQQGSSSLQTMGTILAIMSMFM